MSDIDKEMQKLEQEVKMNASASNPTPVKTNSAVANDNSGSMNKTGSSDHELLQFFIGFVLLGAGVYWILNSFEVSSSWGMYSFFGWNITGGVMMIPLLVGIGLLFFCDKKIIGGCVTVLGIAIILISLLSSVSFHARYNTLYVYVLMFGMVAAGAGLLIKTLFKKR